MRIARIALLVQGGRSKEATAMSDHTLTGGAPDHAPNDALAGRGITEALIAAIAHSTEPMALSDPRLPDHPIIAVNKAFEHISGYTAAEIVGRNCRMMQGPGTDDATARKLGRIIAEGNGCVEWLVNHHKDGTPFWNLLFLSPVRDGEGRIIHYFANQHDITKGLPERLSEVNFGRAHMPAEITAEFQRLVHEIAAATAGSDDPAHARALEGVIVAARRLAEVSSALAPGAA
jgi:PAS domain S-box-containing protein